MTAMRHETIHLRLGPFTAALTTAFREVGEALARLYPPQFRKAASAFADFHVALVPGRGVRRFVRPQARFLI
ncbi:MAG: HprK-related kinase A, partial [Alphaproteobacteria bacterium]|nr:HprK-related kinase A [Alphaproteobacteria bacterium]